MKKEFMKRVMAAGMVAAMALTTVACGGSADIDSASTRQSRGTSSRMQHLQQKQQLPKMMALMMNVH